MTLLSDRAKQYRLRADLLLIAAESICEPEQHSVVRELAQEWIVLAERCEAGVRHIAGDDPSAVTEDTPNILETH